MRHYSVLVFALCIFGALAEDNSILPAGVGDVINLFNDCRNSDGLAPCLKMKALTLIERVSRMEKITLMDGVELKGKPEETSNEPSLEDEEKNLPRSVNAKDEALTNMIVNRVARMIGSKTIEISIPKLIESARYGGEEGSARFGDGGGGGEDKKKMKKEKKKGEDGMKMFIASLAAKKIAMIPLYLGALFILAVKALATAKIALLIIGIVAFNKLLHGKQQQQQPAVHHVSSGGYGGYGGGGWDGGWGRRSIEAAQNLAFKGLKST